MKLNTKIKVLPAQRRRAGMPQAAKTLLKNSGPRKFCGLHCTRPYQPPGRPL